MAFSTRMATQSMLGVAVEAPRPTAQPAVNSVCLLLVDTEPPPEEHLRWPNSMGRSSGQGKQTCGYPALADTSSDASSGPNGNFPHASSISGQSSLVTATAGFNSPA
jgi:hypothetical protein